MRIKDDQFNAGMPRMLRGRPKVLTVIFLTTIFSLGFAAGVIMHKTGLFGRTVVPFVQRPFLSIFNYFSSLTVKPKKMVIDLKHKHVQKIEYKRLEALDRGVLMPTEKEDFFPGKISLDGKTHRVELRLKGDLPDQMLTERWPLRVHVKGEDTILGMKRFSLHIPAAREYITEWLFHKAMKREGVIALRYEFLNVVLNGKNLGTYALEESFEKRLIENNNRREGPIIGFSEELDIARIGQFGNVPEKRASFYDERINLYGEKKTLAAPNLKKAFMMAKNQLESFRRGERSVCQAFDCPVLAKYFAVIDLFNARHAAKYGDFKLYLNPVTSKLEPIAFDAESGDDPEGLEKNGIFAETWRSDVHNGWPLIFKDKEFFTLYVKELNRLSQPSYVQDFLAGVENELRWNLRLIHRSYPWYRFTPDYLYSNQEYIRKVLSPPAALHANFNGLKTVNGKEVLEVGLGNASVFPIQVLGLNLNGGQHFELDQNDVILLPRAAPGPVSVERLTFRIPDDFDWKDGLERDLSVRYILLGMESVRSERVDPWPELDKDFALKSFILRPPNAEKFSFLSINEKSKEIFFKPGTWAIDTALVIPAGYRLLSGKDLKIDLRKGALILSHSPVHFVGSREKPVVIESSDGLGQGLVVINPDGISVLTHVIFRQLTEPVQEDMRLTGSVTFYNADVEMKNCQFVDIKAEDNFNVIRSHLRMENTRFENASSDAFDADFSEGHIAHSFFSKTGNDAIDVSGSRFKINDVYFERIGDKGISVGENSRVDASRLTMREVSVALASKDKSVLNAEDVKVTQAVIGFAAYQKKPEFGPGEINVKGFNGEAIQNFSALEEGSILMVDGKQHKGLEKGLYHALYGDEKSPRLIQVL